MSFHQKPADQGGSVNGDTILQGEIVLDRAKQIAQYIVERVRTLTDDTKPEQAALPDGTAEYPPID